MDWGDILTKVGVGICLGFGVVMLAKLANKKPIAGPGPQQGSESAQEKPEDPEK